VCVAKRERGSLSHLFARTRVKTKLHLGAPRLLGGEQPGRDGDRERGEGDGSGVACFVSRLRVCVVSRWAFGVRQSARWGERRVCEFRCGIVQGLRPHNSEPPTLSLLQSFFSTRVHLRGTDDGGGCGGEGTARAESTYTYLSSHWERQVHLSSHWGRPITLSSDVTPFSCVQWQRHELNYFLHGSPGSLLLEAPLRGHS
jgi:hypothetical protein